jgi:hypothetical protein
MASQRITNSNHRKHVIPTEESPRLIFLWQTIWQVTSQKSARDYPLVKKDLANSAIFFEAEVLAVVPLAI